jgi:hypothetical protein
VVHRSSETSTNQSDVIIRYDDRFLYLVVDWFLVSKIYMLHFILCFCFFVLILTNILQFYPSCFFPHTDKHLAVLSQRTFDTFAKLHRNILQFCPSVLLTLLQNYIEMPLLKGCNSYRTWIIQGWMESEVNVILFKKLNSININIQYMETAT